MVVLKKSERKNLVRDLLILAHCLRGAMPAFHKNIITIWRYTKAVELLFVAICSK
jgi:hypothetical protein